MKQKLGLAQAMIAPQKLLVLEEPFNALDQRTWREVNALLQMLKVEDRTILLTSHRDEDLVASVQTGQIVSGKFAVFHILNCLLSAMTKRL